MSDQRDETMTFRVNADDDEPIKAVLERVHTALKEKGYDPANQIVGYLLSGDPTYITSHLNARNLIRRVERDEVLEELVRAYLEDDE